MIILTNDLPFLWKEFFLTSGKLSTQLWTLRTSSSTILSDTSEQVRFTSPDRGVWRASGWVTEVNCDQRPSLNGSTRTLFLRNLLSLPLLGGTWHCSYWGFLLGAAVPDHTFLSNHGKVLWVFLWVWGHWVHTSLSSRGRGGARALGTASVMWRFQEVTITSFQLFHWGIYITGRNSESLGHTKWLCVRSPWNCPSGGKTLKCHKLTEVQCRSFILSCPNPRVPRKDIYSEIFRPPGFSAKSSFPTAENFTVKQTH